MHSIPSELADQPASQPGVETDMPASPTDRESRETGVAERLQSIQSHTPAVWLNIVLPGTALAQARVKL